MSKITVRQAAFLTGKSRETINTATKDGTLSYTLNAKNHKVIDIAELERVYPLVNSMEDFGKKDTVKPSQKMSDSDSSDIKAELAVLKERLDSQQRERELIDKERQRERRQLEDEIENLRNTLEKTQEQHSKAMLLLTDQTKDNGERAGDQEKKFDELIKANELLRKQNRRVLYELKAQKEMSLFERLFGKKEKKDLNRRVGG